MLFRLASNYSRLDVRTSPSAHSAANTRTPLCASEADAQDSFNYCPTKFSGKRSGLCGMSCASEQGSWQFVVERIAGMIDPGCRRHPGRHPPSPFAVLSALFWGFQFLLCSGFLLGGAGM